MEPLSGHIKIVSPDPWSLFETSGHTYGWQEGNAADTKTVWMVGDSGGQHCARESPMATNRFEVQELQDRTRHQSSTLTHGILGQY